MEASLFAKEKARVVLEDTLLHEQVKFAVFEGGIEVEKEKWQTLWFTQKASTLFKKS